MNWISDLVRRRRMNRDLVEELASHLEERTAELVESGIPEREARLRARREFGNATLLAEQGRAVWTWTWLEQLTQDLRYSLRAIRRAPGFSFVAIASLALGIGGNTAVFSLLDAVMWKNLPVSHPEELRILTWQRNRAVPAKSHSGYGRTNPRTGQTVSGSFPYPALEAFRKQVPLFSGLVGFAASQFNVTAGGASDYASGQFVTGNYFQMLGVRPLLGRPILPSDDEPAQPPVVVLTSQYWQHKFHADPAILSKQIAINRTPTTVIGVAPEGFQGLGAGAAIDFFVPMARVDSGDVVWFSRTESDNWWVQCFGRLRPGATDSAAESALTAVLGHLIEASAGDVPPAGKPPVFLFPGAQGVGLSRKYFSTALSILGGTVCLVLLIACANLANLLLARSAARERELAIRLSIGAGRGRLLRQLFTESLVLAGLGGIVGVAISSPLSNYLVRYQGRGQPLAYDVQIDARTLAFTFAVCILTGLLFGMLPALRATRTDLAGAIKTAGSGATHSRSRLRFSRLLISAQVAFSVVLLVGAALFIRTLVGLARVNLGFRPESLLTFQTDPSRAGYKGEALADLYGRMRSQIGAIPGVESVGMSQHGLIQDVESDTVITIPGHRLEPKHNFTYILNVSDSFLSTVRIPLLLGRDLSPSDGAGAAGHVAVVNETFVRQFLSGENPIGQQFYLGDGTISRDEKPIQIVGVAKDAHYTGVRDVPPPTIYQPYVQGLAGLHQMTFAIRTVLPPLSIAAAVRRAVTGIDASIPIVKLRTQEDQIDATLSTERMFAGLVSFFGVIAAVLAAIGLYGVLSYSIARRTAEIGIRMALGATRRDVLWLTLRGSLLTVGIGIAAGIPAAVALTKVTKSLLFGITPTDTLSYVAASVAMLLVSAFAAWIPTRRAAAIDPTRALRYE